VIKTDSPKPPRGGQTISMAGTIVGIHFATAPTNGIEGTLCTIDFGNAEVVAQPSSKEPEHSTVVTSSMPPQTTYKVVETVTTSEPRAAYIETYTPPATSGYVSADGYWSPTPMISTYGYGQPSGYYRAPTPVYQYRYQSQSGYRCVPQAQRAPVYSSGGHYHSHR
ncbi:MAG: hypothetical protein ACXWC8_12700, partial [Limisphaerales bacterium]